MTKPMSNFFLSEDSVQISDVSFMLLRCVEALLYSSASFLHLLKPIYVFLSLVLSLILAFVDTLKYSIDERV